MEEGYIFTFTDYSDKLRMCIDDKETGKNISDFSFSVEEAENVKLAVENWLKRQRDKEGVIEPRFKLGDVICNEFASDVIVVDIIKNANVEETSYKCMSASGYIFYVRLSEEDDWKLQDRDTITPHAEDCSYIFRRMLPRIILNEFEPIYPLTIICDRYGGAYSGGSYTAFNLDFYEIPEEANGSDVECMAFWDEANKDNIGFGATPQEAYEDLENKLQNKK